MTDRKRPDAPSVRKMAKATRATGKAKKQPKEDVNQTAARIVSQATKS